MTPNGFEVLDDAVEEVNVIKPADEEVLLSVIVAVHGGSEPDYLRNLLEALAKEERGGFEVVLVVSASHAMYERAQVLLRQVNLPASSIVFEAEDRGIAASRNVGVVHGAGRYVAFLDDDAIPQTGWVGAVIDGFEADDKLLGMIGHIDPAWTNGDPTWFPEPAYWLVSCSYYPEDQDTYQYVAGFGANMAFRRSCFEDFGLFDTRLGIRPGEWIGGDETEFYERIRAHRPESIRYLREARVHHTIPARRLNPMALMDRAIAQGKTIALLYTKRNGEEEPLAPEDQKEFGYLGYVVRDFMPGRLRDAFRTRRLRPVLHVLVMVWLVAFVGIGYVIGLLRQWVHRGLDSR